VQLLATDLDGTLELASGALKDSQRRLLHQAGEKGLMRVLLTGRNRYSLEQIIQKEDPFDYICISSGAGILKWPEGLILKESSLDHKEASRLRNVLRTEGCSFFELFPLPENHRFFCNQGVQPPEDFFRRLNKYRFFEIPEPPATSSQFLLILHSHQQREDLIEHIASQLPTLSFIRATSPMDGKTPWLEIFPSGIHKGSALAWICRQENVKAQDTAALGNDWNDLHMLEWAGLSRVVSNSPAPLVEQFGSVGKEQSALEEFLELLDK